jgi:hypothetical protein
MSATASAGQPWIPKPSDCHVVKSLVVQDGGYRTNLVKKTNEWLLEYWPDRASTGTPKYYGDFDGNTLVVAPAFTSANELQMQFVVRPSAISVSSQTNYFTSMTPTALFYASMIETCMYMKDGTAMMQWEQVYQGEVDRLRNEARRERRDDNRRSGGDWGSNNLVKGSS